jgi:hypothetical protein
VVERLLAVQAQDPRAARLAVRARSTGLSAADVDRALTEERSLLVTWLNRGTLHLVRREDYPWLHALTTPPLRTGVVRRLGQEGVRADDAERGVSAIERALSEEGPITRAELHGRHAHRPAGPAAAGELRPHRGWPRRRQRRGREAAHRRHRRQGACGGPGRSAGRHGRTRRERRRGSPYEAHMGKSDGTHVTVKVDSSFTVTSVDTDPVGH